VKRVVSFSSINALGHAEANRPALYLPLDDEVPHFPVRNYPLSKHIGEEMCLAFASRGVFSAVSLRPTLVTYPGPPRFPWFQSIPSEFKIRNMMRDLFSYVDARDVAEAALLSLTAQVNLHQAFLLAAADNILHIPTAELVEKYLPNLTWPNVSKEEYLARGEFISLLDCRAAKQVLGWQPKISQFDPDSGYVH
jgi:UDP-glucose 4-epimerase